jgi:hypothetical protein
MGLRTQPSVKIGVRFVENDTAVSKNCLTISEESKKKKKKSKANPVTGRGGL